MSVRWLAVHCTLLHSSLISKIEYTLSYPKSRVATGFKWLIPTAYTNKFSGWILSNYHACMTRLIWAPQMEEQMWETRYMYGCTIALGWWRNIVNRKIFHQWSLKFWWIKLVIIIIVSIVVKNIPPYKPKVSISKNFCHFCYMRKRILKLADVILILFHVCYYRENPSIK